MSSPNAKIYPNVHLGENATIGDFVIIGVGYDEEVAKTYPYVSKLTPNWPYNTNPMSRKRDEAAAQWGEDDRRLGRERAVSRPRRCAVGPHPFPAGEPWSRCRDIGHGNLLQGVPRIAVQTLLLTQI